MVIIELPYHRTGGRVIPYLPPSLDECVERSRSDFEANLVGSNAWLFPNNVAVSAKVFGGLIWSAFRFLAWIVRQILVSTCDPRYVTAHGAELGMAPNPATVAVGTVQVVMSTPGFTFPNTGQLVRSDGLVLEATADVISDPITGIANVPVTTLLTGAMTNTVVGMPLSSGVAGVASAVSQGVFGGTDAEAIEAFRKRVLYRKRNPPSVGNPADYVRWATDFPGVTRAFVTRAQYGPGTVGVQFMMDGTYSNGIPLVGDVTNLLNYLNDLAPSDADIVVTAPNAQPIDVTIANLQPNTPAVQQAIKDEITGMMQVKGLYSPAATLIFYRSWIDEAISRATGEIAHDLNIPAIDVPIVAGSIATPGVVTFI